MNTSPYKINILTPSDASDLAELEACFFPTPWSLNQYKKILCEQEQSLSTSHEEATLAATPDEWLNLLKTNGTKVVGIKDQNNTLLAYLCVAVYTSIQELEVYNIAVHNSFRSQGLGTLLLARILALAYTCRINTAYLEVRAGNIPAIALYQKLGFKTSGLRKAYYADSGEDALIMFCDLEQTHILHTQALLHRPKE